MVANKECCEYKNTDVGTFPKRWDEPALFADLFNVSGGFSASRDNLSEEGLCYLHYGDIHGRDNSYIDVEDEFYEIPKLNIKVNKISKNMLLDDGDIVFVDASEDDEGVSKYVVIDNPKKLSFVSGLHTIVAKSKNNAIDNKFKRYLFQSGYLKQQMLHYSAGTKVKGINKTNIKKLLIVLPSDPEQKLIAEALSDIDDLIGSLEVLIEKKIRIKQGAMQELITGNMRIPGFKKAWEEMKVSDFGEIITGGTPSTSNPNYWNGNILWVTPTDICNEKNIYDSDRKITNEGLKTIRCLQPNSVLITCIASIGKNAIIRSIGASNQQINAIIPNANFNPDFLYYLFENNVQKLYSRAGITATNIISKNIFKEIEFLVPMEIDEQIAICSILSEMDEEIEILRSKQNKYIGIKLGMMQELLSGRVCL